MLFQIRKRTDLEDIAYYMNL